MLFGFLISLTFCIRGQEKNMREILGKHVRRLGDGLPEMETQLINAAHAGNTQTVKLGKVVKMKGQPV